MSFPNSNDPAPQHRRRRRPRSSATVATAAILAIFASAQANVVIVQPPDLPVHSPSDPVQSHSAWRQQPLVEYYPPPQPESAPHLGLQSHSTNAKPNITKKKQNRKNSSHQPHSPWHAMRNTPTKPQVILRPRPSYSSSESLSVTANGKTIYYYDPSSLSTSEQDAPTLTLPEVIYDAEGNTKKLEEIHDGGRTEVFLEVKPKIVWGDRWNEQFADLASLNEKLHTNATDPDQLIVFGTIATMAVLVGALSARRLRHKRLLEHCMDGDVDEDWEQEKGAPRGGGMNRGEGSAIMGGRRYESFGGSLHWRGDLEKFDV